MPAWRAADMSLKIRVQTSRDCGAGEEKSGGLTLFVKANLGVKHFLRALQTSLFYSFIPKRPPTLPRPPTYYVKRRKLIFKWSECHWLEFFFFFKGKNEITLCFKHPGAFILAHLHWSDQHRLLSQFQSHLSLFLHSGTAWGPSQTLWIHPKGFRCCGTQQ